MKPFFNHIPAVLLAATIFLVGSGVNYVHYCCHECSAKGITEVAKELSEANRTATNSNTPAETDDCCSSAKATHPAMACKHSMANAKTDCCKVVRLQIDLNDQIAKIAVNADYTWSTLLHNNLLLSTIKEYPVRAIETIDPPPLYTSRLLLSLKSVLLI